MHSNLWTLCAKLRQLDARITILSTGILLKKWVDHVLRWTDGVTVSLDGSPEVHNDIRRIPRAFEKLQNGVRALKEEQPDFRITARSVVQRRNYFNLPNIVDSAKDMGLDEISFLAADVTSTAFNRPGGWDTERALDIAMSPPEVATFHSIVERMIRTHRGDFQSGFISETPEEMRRIVQHFRALNGQVDFPTSRCNAPWVSTVIEADGTVRPCFFHDELGNIHDDSLADILNSEEAVNFRRNLDVSTNPTCERCTCTLKMSAFSSV